MSIKIMSWVWDYSPYEGKQLLIHLAFADWANDDGVCWPNQESIATKCRCSVETVRTATRAMERDGYLHIVEASKGRGSSHKYLLRTPKSFGLNTETPKSTDQNPQIDGPKPPNPSPKNHQEPPLEPSRRRCAYCNQTYLDVTKHRRDCWATR